VAQSTSKNLPAVKPKPGAIAKQKSERFINILKDDHNFDIVSKVLEHIGLIERAKKIRPLEKHRLLQNYYLTLLSYCLPRIKIQEQSGDDTGKGVVFNINIGGEAEQTTTSKPLKKAGKGKASKTGVNITVPTRQHADGSYSIDKDETIG
jgi:hypothetical protein